MPAAETDALPLYSRAQLALRNGTDRDEIWCAYQGVIYDVSTSRLWRNGKHYEHWAGQDLTDELADAPHADWVFWPFYARWPTSPTMKLLIADSGSTKTEWQLVKNEQVLINVRTTGFNPYYADTATIVAGLREQLLPALAGTMPGEVYFYGSGCTGPAANQVVADALRTVWPAVGRVDVESDMLGAARAACGRGPGVVCILGTGSNAAVYDGTALVSPSRSLGFWLGDEGSGAYLGRTLVVQFLHGLLPPDLAGAFRYRFAIDRLTVLDSAYHQPFPNRYFSQFTPFLSENADNAFVNKLVVDAFTAFLRLYVLPYSETTQEPVSFVGSVARYFEGQLRQAVADCALRIGRIVPTPIDELVRFHQTR